MKYEIKVTPEIDKRLDELGETGILDPIYRAVYYARLKAESEIKPGDVVIQKLPYILKVFICGKNEGNVVYNSADQSMATDDACQKCPPELGPQIRAILENK